MNPWIFILLASVVVGAVCGFAIRSRWAVLLGGAIPWCGLLAWLLYNEYFVPYQGGGASMWPVAQLVAGTVSAVVGAISTAIVRRVRGRV